MSLYAIRAEIAAYYRREISGVEVLEHGGPFTLEDLKRVSAKAPALVVACLGVPEITVVGSQPVAEANFGVVVVTKDTIRETRDVAALLYMEKVAAAVPFQRWNDLARRAPSSISAANQYSPALDKHGISMWTVTWRQQVELEGATIDVVSLTKVITKLDSTAVSTPTEPDAEDNITLEGS